MQTKKNPRLLRAPATRAHTRQIKATAMSESIEPLSLPPGLLASLQQKAKDKNTSLNALLAAAVTWCAFVA